MFVETQFRVQFTAISVEKRNLECNLRQLVSMMKNEDRQDLVEKRNLECNLRQLVSIVKIWSFSLILEKSLEFLEKLEIWPIDEKIKNHNYSRNVPS
jgi:hypothetical protein